jgi:hypothetical protein
MKRWLSRSFVIVPALVVAFSSAACRDNQDPQGATELWSRVSQSGYRSWTRARAYPKREPSFTLHGGSVEIFVNPTLAAARDGKTAFRQFPDGSMVVKEGYSGNSDDLAIVAVMEKRAGEWYFAEYSGDGEALFSGKPKVCVDCHEARREHSDWLFSVELPR